jgi:predicted Zn-dependent peptidase
MSRYHAGSVFIVVSGGIKYKNVIKLLNRAFSGLSAKGTGVPLSAPAPSAGVALFRRDLEQVHLCMGVAAIPQSHPDRYKLYLLNTILGGGMSSRLFQEIREKRGLAYSVYSYLNLMMDAGSLVIYAATAREDFRGVTELVFKECEKLKKGVKPEELRVAKEQLKGGLFLGLDTTDSRMMKIARDEIYFGRVQPIKEMIEAIDEVASGDIKEMAREVLTGDITMVAMGKVGEKDLLRRLRSKVVYEGAGS